MGQIVMKEMMTASLNMSDNVLVFTFSQVMPVAILGRNSTSEMKFLMHRQSKKYFRPKRFIATHLYSTAVHILCGFKASILAANNNLLHLLFVMLKENEEMKEEQITVNEQWWLIWSHSMIGNSSYMTVTSGENVSNAFRHKQKKESKNFEI